VATSSTASAPLMVASWRATPRRLSPVGFLVTRPSLSSLVVGACSEGGCSGLEISPWEVVGSASRRVGCEGATRARLGRGMSM